MGSSADVEVYISDEGARLARSQTRFEDDPRAENDLVKIYPGVTYQAIIGFGGAFTESAASLYAKLSVEDKRRFVDAYFSDGGSRYSLCRTHIQSCDFSLGSYAYVGSRWDKGLRHFTLDRDKELLIPMIVDALAVRPDLSLLASPWSPPAFMKTNHSMMRGGHLKPAFYEMWAAVLARYAHEYRQMGIPIDRMTVQNEQHASQSWESCVMNHDEELDFAVNHLRRALQEADVTDMALLAWDHNKERMLERAAEAFSSPEGNTAIDGVAFHWYSGDHFEAVAECARRWPEKELIMTEGCAELSRDPGREIDIAQHYAHDIMGDLNAGAHGWIDWNLLLDDQGGPNHANNWCAAPIWFDRTCKELHLTASYAYIAHFSRFIRPQARRVLASRFSDVVEATAFANPDGSRVAVILNRTAQERRLKLHELDASASVVIPPRGIATLVWHP